MKYWQNTTKIRRTLYYGILAMSWKAIAIATAVQNEYRKWLKERYGSLEALKQGMEYNVLGTCIQIGNRSTRLHMTIW